MSIDKLDQRMLHGENEIIPYAQIARECLQGITNLDALGIFSYLQSLPPTWVIRKNHIMDRFGISRERYAKAVKYLCDYGLITYCKKMTAGGKMAGQTIHIHSTPTRVRNNGTSLEREVVESAAYRENTSTEETSIEKREPTVAPEEQKPERIRGKPCTLVTFLASIPEGEPAIPKDHHVLRFAKAAGIPDDFMRIAWWAFKRKYMDDTKAKYIDWITHFRKAIEQDWLRVWRVADDGAYRLTTAGMQIQAALNGSQQVAR